jgi:hypothetical protein
MPLPEYARGAPIPEIPEPIRRESRISNSGQDRAVAEIGLDGAGVMAVVGKLEPACVPQHVGMARVDRAAAIGQTPKLCY